MKKSIIALAVAGALTAPLAQADATLYGVAQFRLIDKDESSLNAQMAKTRLGVKGTVDNDIEGLTTGFQFEWEFSGANGDAGGVSELRKSNVYAKGDFGQATFGKQNNPFAVVKKADVLGHNSAAFSVTGDRVENAITYATPTLGGFQLTAGITADGASDANNANQSNDVDSSVVAATFGIAGLDLAVAHQATNSAAANSDIDVTGFGASYSMGAFTVAAYYEDEDRDAAADRKHYELAASYSIGKTTVTVQHANRDTDGVSKDEKKTALRVDYALGSSAGIALEIADYNDTAADASNAGAANGNGFNNDNVVLEYTLSF